MKDDNTPLGVILTGGKATRLRPLSNFYPKSQIPLLNKPLIEYAMDLLAEAGIQDIAIVVGPDDKTTGPIAKKYRSDVEVSVHVQKTPKGSGDALAACGESLQDRDVIVLAVDTILQDSMPGQIQLQSQIDTFIANSWDVWLPLHKTDQPTQMGIAELDDSEKVISLEEKPDFPKSDLALVGIWMLAEPVVKRIQFQPEVSARGEIEISGMLETIHSEGGSIGGRLWQGSWLDTGTLSALLESQKQLLGERTHLIDPSAQIIDSAVGENVVIGKNSALQNVEIKNALVPANVQLRDIAANGIIVTPDGEITYV